MHYTAVSILCLVLCVLNAIAIGIKKVSVDVGKNVTLKCPVSISKDIMWEREGKGQKTSRTKVLDNGNMFIQEADRSDSGIWNCIRQNDVIDTRGQVNVTVRTPPPPLVVSIKPSTILVLVLWEVKGTGGYPITYFTAQFRPKYSDIGWIPISPNHIMPSSRQLEVYNLTPNTSYEFRMWATNQLGKSPIVNVTATTRGYYTQEELARHLLKGAEHFDTRLWAVAVGVFMGTFLLLVMCTCILLCYEYRKKTIVEEESEVIELLPNIILNPGFEGPSRATPDENWNNETPTRLNNNTVVQPPQEF